MDTVQDSVTGFSFRYLSVDDFWQALQRAIYAYSTDRPGWKQIQLNGMNADYSWERSSLAYEALYREAINRHA